MENIKKIMAIVGVIAIAALLLGFVTNPSNEGNEKYLTVKVMEAQGAALGSFMIIVDENGNQETIVLEKLAAKKDPFVNNAIKINKTVNSIGEKGYKLVAQSGGNDQFCLTTTYTFVKK